MVEVPYRLEKMKDENLWSIIRNSTEVCGHLAVYVDDILGEQSTVEMMAESNLTGLPRTWSLRRKGNR